ncbi:MAG: hypothetical protein R3E97_19015 [Candidatus Eisenbacteria bacterium]
MAWTVFVFSLVILHLLHGPTPDARGQTSLDSAIASDWQAADGVVLVTAIDTVAVIQPPAASPGGERDLVLAAIVDSTISGDFPSAIEIGIRYTPGVGRRPVLNQQYLMTLWNCGDVWRILPGRYWQTTRDSVSIPRLGTFALFAVIDSVRTLRSLCSAEAQSAGSDAVIRGRIVEDLEYPSDAAPRFHHWNRATLTVALSAVLKNTTAETLDLATPVAIEIPFREGARPWFHVDHDYVLFLTGTASGWMLNPTVFSGWEVVGDSAYVARVTPCRNPVNPGGRAIPSAALIAIAGQ